MSHSDEENEADLVMTRIERARVAVLLGSILLIALCGIAYELIVGTISSYFLGNSVLEFSITIGVFMSSMGLGSYLSRFVVDDLLGKFLRVELVIGLIGGLTSPLLFVTFAHTDHFRLAQLFISMLIGALVGIEIPLLTRFLRRYSALRVAIAQVLSWDYVGALVGSVAFPLLLLPGLGLIGASLAVGLVNLAVALVGAFVYYDEIVGARRFMAMCVAAFALHLGLFVFAGGIERVIDQQLYEQDIIYSEQTPYQKLVVTRWGDDLRLYIDGKIQFSATDEYRYHEALVHVPMAMAQGRSHVLILGGGDGLATREVLRWDGVERVTLVDLDPAMTRIASDLDPLAKLNESALEDPRVEIVNDDAMSYLEETGQRFDVAIADLPDPANEALAKLYSRRFYVLLRQRLEPGGVAVTQSTSPYYARRAFWSIHQTMEAAFCPGEPQLDACSSEGHVLAYRLNVPSFGQWGFNVAASHRLPPIPTIRVRPETRFLTPGLIPTLFVFPADEDEVDVDLNRLIDPALLHYYLDDWSRWDI